jgi:GT2 family glycosyltransferase
VVVVDNQSTDHSEKACQNYPFVRLIQNGANLGFGKACNIGAKNIQGNWVLFLNPDAKLNSETLTKLNFNIASVSDQYVIHGVQIVDSSGSVSRSCARFPKWWNLFFHSIGLDRIFPKIGFQMIDWDHSESRPVDEVMGSFFLVRRDIFNRLHGFDEDYFMYMEELDFSYRARQVGFLSYYWASPRIFHEGGGCSKQVKAKRLYYYLRSRWIYSGKHFPLLQMACIRFALLFFEPVSRVANSAWHLEMSSIIEILQSYIMFIGWLIKYWQKK